jgi:hypothetical protein
MPAKKIPYEVLVELEKKLAARQANQFANLAFLHLNLGRQASLPEIRRNASITIVS